MSDQILPNESTNLAIYHRQIKRRILHLAADIDRFVEQATDGANATVDLRAVEWYIEHGQELLEKYSSGPTVEIGPISGLANSNTSPSIGTRA